MSQPQTIRVRFAPSPTGRTHLGSARTALYDYLLARQHGGQFVLRIEDTDQKRYVPGSEEGLMRSLRWLGLDWDEGPDIGGPYGPYRQTERRELYQMYARQLVEQGQAYYCFCTPDRLEKVRQEQQKQKLTPHYDGLCRHLAPDESAARVARNEKHVVRFKMPRQGEITVTDLVRGPITVSNSMLDDSILIKSDGLAVYHFAAMLDDQLMKISHVIRGSEWLSTFPLHGHIIRAFGWQEPVFVHLSVFLKPSGKGKMSKREAAQAAQDGHSIFIEELQALGYTPEGVLNWITLMGWSYDDHTEFFTLDDLVARFNLEHLNPSPAAINFTKLDHFNGLHIRHLQPADLAQRVKPFFEAAGYRVDEDTLLKIIPLIRERLITLDDALAFGAFFFKTDIQPAFDTLIGKDLSAAESAAVLERCLGILSTLPEIAPETAEPPLRALVDELGLSAGQVFGILRVAVTGQTVSPPLFESMAVIGRAVVLRRVQQAIARLKQGPA